MRTYGKARECDCYYNACRSNPKEPWSWFLYDGVRDVRRNRTRKDWRMRCWPCGANDQAFKRAARRALRRTARKLELYQGTGAERKLNGFYSYDINDFK